MLPSTQADRLEQRDLMPSLCEYVGCCNAMGTCADNDSMEAEGCTVPTIERQQLL